MNSFSVSRAIHPVAGRFALLACTLLAWLFTATSVSAQSVQNEARSLGRPEGTAAVSNPALDFVHSLMQGFTQFQSSSAWCGDSIAVGYKDTRTAFILRQGLPPNFEGLSVSTDSGQTFEDIGPLQPATNQEGFVQVLQGEAALACSSAEKFYYATTASVDFDSDIVVAQTSGSAADWAPPTVAVVSVGAFPLGGLQSPWIAVDPTNAARLFLTYTRIGTVLPSECAGGALESVSSSDGGNTWSAPVILDSGCLSGSITGSNVTVSADGRVYVVYLANFLDPSTFQKTFQLRFATSQDHGNTFGMPQAVATFTPPGGGLAGNLPSDSIPAVAVDRSQNASRGTIYVAWGQPNQIEAQNGEYPYSDVIVAKSVDQGASFTSLGAISPTPAGFKGKGRDQFLPGIAVDKKGDVAVCYYDRRNDPNNLAIDRFCSLSVNQGKQWTDQQVSSPNWLPFYWDQSIIAGPSIPTIKIGLYDTVTSDWTLTNTDFFGAFQFQTDGNPDLIGKRLGTETH